MDINSKICILELLKQRNDKEHSFREIIKYSKKLLEKLDYAQKENALKNFPALLHEQTAPDSHDSLKSGDSSHRTNLEILQRNLAESHTKISGLAEQVINLKDVLERTNFVLSKRTAELDKAHEDLRHSQEMCKTLQSDVILLKKHLQNKIDEYDALNITYSCIENQKNEFETENRRLRGQLSLLANAKEKSSSTESFEKSFESVSSLASVSSNKSGSSTDRRKSNPNAKLSQKSTSPKPASAKSSSPKPSSTTKSPAESGKCPNVVFIPERMKFAFSAHDSEVNGVLWFPTVPKDSSFLMTAGADRRLKVWEVSESEVKLLKSARDCNSSIMSIDIDPEAGLVLCASGDFASRVWTIADFTLRHTLTGHSGRVLSAKFVNENCKIVSGSADQTLKLWDFPQKVCTVTYNAQAPVNDVVSRDTHSIISAHCDTKIRFWDPRAKSEVATIVSDTPVTSLDVSRSLTNILASEYGNKLKIFDVRTYKAVQSMNAVNFEIACNFVRAKFSPDGRYCACGSKNGSSFVWNSATGAIEKELKSQSSVISCCWSLCGSYLATSEKNKNCVVWSKCK